MTSYKHRRQPMSISTINDVDIDDIRVSSREEYRRPFNYEETITTTSSLEKRKTFWCLTTLILILTIISLLSIAALIIGIYSLVLITKNSGTVTTTLSTSSTSTTTSVTSTSLICSSSPTTSYVYSTVAPSQCFNYTNNTDSTRNVGYTNSINYCDNLSPFVNTTSVWIRFLDPAGTLIITSPVSPNRCGTVATGWYAGQYPIQYFTTATSIVCFYYSTNTCFDCSSISVTNCKTFSVYSLPIPNDCNYRYCTV